MRRRRHVGAAVVKGAEHEVDVDADIPLFAEFLKRQRHGGQDEMRSHPRRAAKAF